MNDRAELVVVPFRLSSYLERFKRIKHEWITFERQVFERTLLFFTQAIGFVQDVQQEQKLAQLCDGFFCRK